MTGAAHGGGSLASRKGARRRSEIPPEVLQGLNEGRLETVTLVEWLAIDLETLLLAVLDEAGLAHERARLQQVAKNLAASGVTQRVRGIGAALYEVSREHGATEAVFEALARHRSDMVRAWAAFMVTADGTLSLEARLAAARRFAADRSVAVRECAWDSFRPYLAADLERGLDLLRTWLVDGNENVRRCAIEATRPRGVWTAHIDALKREPERGLPLLEPVRSDSSRYVQRAVGNWLNDASKSRPDWTRSLCERWLRESPTSETTWIVNHALRTLRKAAARATRAG